MIGIVFSFMLIWLAVFMLFLILRATTREEKQKIGKALLAALGITAGAVICTIAIVVAF